MAEPIEAMEDPTFPFLNLYKWVKPLGKGGQATVIKFKLKSDKHFDFGPRLPSPVAVKIFDISKSAEREKRDRQREQENLYLKQDHQNIVSYYGFDRRDDCEYNFTQFCDLTLEDFCNENREAEWYEPVSYLLTLEVLRCCHYMHDGPAEDYPKLGIAHRDLKPTNILVLLQGGDETDPCVKVTDLGHSRQLPFDKTHNASTQYSGKRGTESYMPPEMAATVDNNENILSISPKLGDIWSCALTILFIHLGKSTPDSVKEVKDKALCTMLEKMLSSDPQSRPSFAALLTLDLFKQQWEVCMVCNYLICVLT